MIVDRHRAHAILQGTITQTVIPWKASHNQPIDDPVFVVKNGRARRKRSYSQQLPKPGQHTPIRNELYGAVVGHVEITSCHKTNTHQAVVDDLDAIAAMGYDDQTGYIAAWLIDRDTDWIARRAPTGVYATTMSAADAAIATGDPDLMVALANRWAGRWAPAPVWVITFQPAHDIDHYLAGPPRVKFTVRHDGRHVVDDGIRDQDRGYTGDGVRPVPISTDLEDRGLTTRPSGALVDAGVWQDPDDLSFTWANGAVKRHEQALGRKHRIDQRTKILRAR